MLNEQLYDDYGSEPPYVWVNYIKDRVAREFSYVCIFQQPKG